MSPRPISDADYAALSARVKRGPKNAYAAGKRLEYKVINELRALGFVTLRSAGSKGAIDVVAFRPGELLMIQVKRTTPPGPQAWNALYDMAAWVSGVPILATCEPYRPISYERIVFRKPLPRAGKHAPGVGRDHRVDPSGRVPYALTASNPLQEAEEDGDDWA